MASTQTVTAADFTPQVINLCFTQEDAFPFQFTLLQDGSAIDLTGSTFLLTVDPEEFPSGSGGNLFQLSENNTPGVSGIVEFLPTQVNMDQTPSTYFYDIQWTDASGNVRTVIRGEFQIQGQVTQ